MHTDGRTTEAKKDREKDREGKTERELLDKNNNNNNNNEVLFRRNHPLDRRAPGKPGKIKSQKIRKVEGRIL